MVARCLAEGFRVFAPEPPLQGEQLLTLTTHTSYRRDGSSGPPSSWIERGERERQRDREREEREREGEELQERYRKRNKESERGEKREIDRETER